MKTYKADLHIHTCLSPCAALDMSPRNIIKIAKQSGLDIIGICDHNSCDNVIYVQKSAKNMDISVIGGMEITSREEVHILALFDTEETLFAMQKIIYENLPGKNDERMYGDQVVVNEKNEVIAFNERLLIGATELSVEYIVDKIHEFNGLAIASHADRDSFSIISQLGFVPEGLPIDALEVSKKEKIDNFKAMSLPLVTFSDAHQPNDIGKQFTIFTMEQINIIELKKSIIGEDGRRIEL